MIHSTIDHDEYFLIKFIYFIITKVTLFSLFCIIVATIKHVLTIQIYENFHCASYYALHYIMKKLKYI